MSFCEECKCCYNGCLNSFPEKYINGGAENCKGFFNEKDLDVVLKNMKRKYNDIRNNYATKGIYV
jgi:hypothetical protein